MASERLLSFLRQFVEDHQEVPAERITRVRSWYDARNVFFGLNYELPDAVRGYDMATTCTHEDAVWLCSVVTRKDLEDAHHGYMLTALFENLDPPSLQSRLFAQVVFCEDENTITDAARSGHSFAQAFILELTDMNGDIFEDDEIQWLFESAIALEPSSLYILAKICFLVEPELCTFVLQLATKLGCVKAQYMLVEETYNECDPNAYTILHDCSTRGRKRHVTLVNMFNCIDSYRCGDLQYGSATFEIGRLVRGKIGPPPCLLYNISVLSITDRVYPDISYLVRVSRIRDCAIFETFHFAIALYEHHTQAALLAIHAWSIIAKRKNVVKDIRILIAKMIWNDRGNINGDRTNVKLIRRLNTKKIKI